MKKLLIIIFLLSSVCIYCEQRISAIGITIIKHYESFVAIPYWDLPKYDKKGNLNKRTLTQGYGETKNIGGTWTEEYASNRLENRVLDFSRPITIWLGFEIAQNKFDALTSLAYNRGSIKKPMQKAVKSNDLALVKFYFMECVYSGGKYYSGLERRRKTEWRYYSEGMVKYV